MIACNETRGEIPHPLIQREACCSSAVRCDPAGCDYELKGALCSMALPRLEAGSDPGMIISALATANLCRRCPRALHSRHSHASPRPCPSRDLVRSPWLIRSPCALPRRSLHSIWQERRAPLHKSLPPSVAARQGGDRQEQSSTLHAQHSARMPHASRLTLTCSPFGDPATVSVADTGAGLCVWVNRATGQLGNWATGQLVPSGDNGATGRRPASATSTQPSYLPTFRPSDLPTFLTFLPSFLPTVPSYLRRSVFVVEDRLLWFTINAVGFTSK